MTWYALATYETRQGNKTALLAGNSREPVIVDLEDAWQAAGNADDRPTWLGGGMLDVVQNWHKNESSLEALAETALAKVKSGELETVPGGTESIRAPLRPPRIFAAASNYVEHAKEMGTVLAKKADSNPYMFIKASTAVIGPGETVIIPPETSKPDWEVELAAVIGRRARRIGTAEALDYVAGYTILNDVSARDLTRRSDFPFKFDWFQGKSFDTFAPLGPWIVAAKAIDDPQALDLGMSVNGESMQDGSTAEMIFSVSEQISYLSTLLTLEPGDVIATGTPTGVGASRGIFLADGDVMRASVENIGELVNPVAAEAV